MKRVVIYSFVMMAALTALVFAQGKPDFSGTWVFDAAKSDLGQIGVAKKVPMRTITLVLKQTNDVLTVQRMAGEQKETATYKLDGSESTNKLPGGNEAKTTMKWVGATLVGKTTAKMGDSESTVNVEMVDVRSLSANGQLMTIVVTRQTPRGEVKQTLLYNKQK